MANFKITKETALPSSALRTAHTIYLISAGTAPGGDDLFEMYVTGTTGAVIRRLLDQADVTTMINNALSNQSSISIEADIAGRDALDATQVPSIQVLVLDASADPTVDAGAATYISDPALNGGTGGWHKIAEHESLDVTLDWNNLVNGPASTPAQIDQAVADSHTHANKTELDLIGQDGDGDITYNGASVQISWINIAW